jgi:rhodanese-related sulfurtransferase
MKRSLLRILFIVGVSAGTAAGYVAIKGWHWIPSKQEITAWHQSQDKQKAVRAQSGIELAEFKELLDLGAIVVDARPRAEFEQGHLRVDIEPPVLNVPVDAVDAAQINRLMQAQQQTGFPIVLYCTSRTCDFAEELYAVLEPYGFVEMKIFLEGWEGIQRAGLPTATGPDVWKGFLQTASGGEATEANVASGLALARASEH